MATIIGTGGNDLITPGSVSSGVTGGLPSSAADSITGGGGSDTINGGGGADTINGGNANERNRLVIDQGSLNGATFAELSSARDTFTLTSGGVVSRATGFTNFDVTLGTNSTVNIFVPIFAENSLSTVTVASGTLNLDWSGAVDSSGANNLPSIVSVNSGVASQLGFGDPIRMLFNGFTQANIRTGNTSDSISGTTGADTLNGSAGNDTIIGGGGADSIDGGPDNDTFIAGDLSAFGPFNLTNTASATALSLGTSGIRIANIEALGLTTGAGNDTLSLAGGNDSIAAGAGNNSVSTGGGNDEITTTGIDTVDGGAGNDFWQVQYGSVNNLTVTQGANGAFTISNGASGASIERYAFTLGTNATVTLGAGSPLGLVNSVSVGSGSLTLDWSGKTTGSSVLLNAAGTAQVASGTGANIGAGNLGTPSADERLFLAGFTTANIRTGSGNDSVRGATGADTISTGAGDDTIRGGGGADQIDAGDGNDIVFLDLSALGGVTFTLNATAGATSAFTGSTASVRGVETLNLITGAGNDNLTLGAANDTIAAGLGTNTVNGGAGDDVIVTTGVDNVNGGTGTDVWQVRLGSTANLSITLGATTTVSNGASATGVERLDIELGTGASINASSGLTLGQVHRFAVADGALTLNWSTRNNGSGVYTNLGTSVADLTNRDNAEQVSTSGFTAANITTGSGNDTIYGTSGVDTIAAGNGNDFIDGIAGADIIDGGGGNDVARLDLSAFGATAFTLVTTANTDSTFSGNGARVRNVETLGIVTGAGNDTLSLGGGNDTIDAGLGRNSVSGGAGNDDILTTGFDTVDGGAGIDNWIITRDSVADVRLNQVTATSFTSSGGIEASNVENVNARLGTGAIVNLGEGAVGSSSFYSVASGSLTLDWSAKTTNAFINVDNSQAYGNIANSSLAEVYGLNGFTSAVVRSGAGNDTISGLGASGTSTLFGGAGNDQISSYGVDSINGGDGIDTWNGRYFLTSGLTLTQTGAASFTVSNGVVATQVEVYNVSLGANATVALRSGGAVGRFSSIDVASGTLTLDWSAKTTGSFIQANNNTSYGSYAGDFLTDEVLSTYGFTSATILTGAGIDYVNGTTGGDEIRTGAGNDNIDGLGGADTIFGGLGDDNYIVNATGARIVERLDEGIDTVFASVNASLSNNVELLVLTGSAALTGAGNALANRIFGNGGANSLSGEDGNDLLVGGDAGPGGLAADNADTLSGGEGDDTLEGGAGDDRMVGGNGNDTYIVDSAGDLTIETANGGTDLVVASVNVRLRNGIENLDLVGSTGLTGTGNGAANRITGTGLDDRLSGSGGADTLIGGDGNDTLLGGAGNDLLTGGAGADRIDGGIGRDVFRFAAPAEGADVILAYVGADDQVEVSAAGFGGGLAAGVNLGTSGRYIENTTGLAASAAGVGQFVFETDTARLWWDADGAGGAAGVVIARFDGLVTLGASEITVIA